jgi:hypothetical protein
MNVPTEPAKFRHDCRRFEAAGMGQGCSELGAPIEGVMALASFDLDILGGDGRTLLAGECLDRGALGLDPEALGALLGSRYAKVGDEYWGLGDHGRLPDRPFNVSQRVF